MGRSSGKLLLSINPTRDIIGSLCALLLCFSVSKPAYGLNESRLWLPKNKAELKLKLFRAAKLAEELPDCVDVVSGTLHLKESTEARPVFKIVCRNAERRTYPVLMDGVDYVYLNPPPAPPPPPEPEPEPVVDPEVERLAREAEFWRICEAGLKARSKNMLAVEWLYEAPATPVYEGDEPDNITTRYELPFDAKDIQSHILHFKGLCEFKTVEDFTIDIKPR